MTKRQERPLEVAEMRMLRFSLGVTSKDNSNEHIRGTLQVGGIGKRSNTEMVRPRATSG